MQYNIIPAHTNQIPAFPLAGKWPSAKPAHGAVLRPHPKSRTMAAVTQATTAIISSIKFKLCTSSIKSACYRMTK